MSSAGIETLRNGYMALAARDEDRLMDCLADDVELRTLTGSFRGHDGIRHWIAEMDEGWSRWGLTVDAIKDLGDRVLIEATLSGRSSRTNIPMSHQFWVVWEVRGGQAVRGTHYADREQALQAS